MIVLVGCERSGVVSSAFRAAGHTAYSCDILPCYGGDSAYHLQGDLREIYDTVNPDLFIAHPPCTYLSKAGIGFLVDHLGNIKDELRYKNGLAAKDFFLWCLSRSAPMVCVVNPVPIRRYQLPKPTQIIQPFYFGDPYSKQTCLWLRGLPPLLPSNFVRSVGSWTALHKSQRIRSQTFGGVAAAMVSAWGSDLVGFQYTLGVF